MYMIYVYDKCIWYPRTRECVCRWHARYRYSSKPLRHDSHTKMYMISTHYRMCVLDSIMTLSHLARTTSNMRLHLWGCLQSVGSFKFKVSFARYHLFYRTLLKKRPIISRSLLIVATPNMFYMSVLWCNSSMFYITWNEASLSTLRPRSFWDAGFRPRIPSVASGFRPRVPSVVSCVPWWGGYD